MTLTLFLIIIGALFLVLGIVGIIFIPDWRGIAIRRYGPDYTKGLAHIKLGHTSVYRDSELYYEGDKAASYTRTDENGDLIEDIVPHDIGFTYDEYTGRRLYRVIPGGVVAYSDEVDAPAVNFPARLISVHVLDRLGEGYSSSVQDEGGGLPWKGIIFGAVVLLVIAGFAIYQFGVKPGMDQREAQQQEQTQEKPADQPGEVTIKEVK